MNSNQHFTFFYVFTLKGQWKIQCKLPPKTKAILPP